MPRLIGRQSNNGLYGTLVLMVAIAAFVSLEYFGVINLIPGFGHEQSPFERSTNDQPSGPRNRP